MHVSVELCQLAPAPGDPSKNAGTVLDLMSGSGSDVFVFPEMFLTGYGADTSGMEDDVSQCVGMISDSCRDLDKAVAIGSPRFGSECTYNSLLFLSPDGDTYYDKTHLAKFGMYSEVGFTGGNGPGIGSYHGMLFGMCICYDIFFPEILHGCSLAGADVNICSAASAIQSKPFLDTVLPARALENVTYLAYVNNTGPMNRCVMHGCSRGLDPFGKVMTDCGTAECTRTMTIDTDELNEFREIRHHLADFRSDIDWGVQRF